MTIDEFERSCSKNKCSVDYDCENEWYWIDSDKSNIANNVIAIVDKNQLGCFRFFGLTSKDLLKSVIKFADTPIKNRKPKPKKYVAIIGQDSDDGDVFVYWTLTDRPNGDLFIGDVYSPTLCEDDYYLTLRQIHQLRMYCKKHEIPQPVVKSVDEFKKEIEK